MSKHTHHETNEEQRSNKEHGKPPFHYDPYKSSGSVKLEDIPIDEKEVFKCKSCGSTSETAKKCCGTAMEKK